MVGARVGHPEGLDGMAYGIIKIRRLAAQKKGMTAILTHLY